MNDSLRKIAIYISALFSCAAFTVISPFYSKAALGKGISVSTIGLVFSLSPLSALVASWLLPKRLERLGRSRSLLLGLLLIGSSNIILACMTFASTSTAIFLSFFSRYLAGTGSAMAMVSSFSILTSDYPQEISSIVAVLEMVSSIGLILGPTIGSVFYAFGGFFYSCFGIGAVLIAYCPLLYFSLGKSRAYVISKDTIEVLAIIKKPVIYNQKIALDVSLQLLCMFSIGYLIPTMGLHFLSYGVKESNLGYMYSLNTVAYGISSMMVSVVTKHVKKQKIMLFGASFLIFAFLLLGPSPLFFERSLALTSIGYTMSGLAGGFMYGNQYLVPSLPHMIEVAHTEYGFLKDDRLNDALSAITNMSLCIGEIIGPVVSSVLYDGIGFENASSVISLVAFLFALNYLVFGDVFPTSKATKLNEELIEM